MNRVITVVVTVAISMICADVYSQDIWMNKDGSVRNVDTRAMLIEDDRLYLATKNEIYASGDTKDRWQSIFSLPAGENEISCLTGNSKNMLIGTRRGLFRSRDFGKSWRNVFRTILPEKNNILCIEQSKHNPEKILIGTEKGVFSSDDAGDHWKDISGVLKNKRVEYITLNSDHAYAFGDNGLYVKNGESSGWSRIYGRSAAGEKGDDDSSGHAETEGDSGAKVSCMALKGSRIYIGAGKGIVYSDDHGKSWSAFSSDGLAGKALSIAASDKSEKFYCATTKGIFEFVKDKSRWLELYKGIDRSFFVNRIVLDGENEGSIWALTDKGLYRLESGRYASDQLVDVERNLKSFKIIFDNEPVFKELRQAALNFNDVSPEKIKKWHGESRLRALLPRVTVGVDKNRSTSSEIYTSATKDYIVTGPDDITNGFDVAVYWELGDLVWSDDQTNIDVRSRLNTQLRNDILDDLRRVYYERKRLQFELMAFPPKDLKARFEKEARIQELTQAIDDLTGNYLSDHMKTAPASSR
ncbi:MAG: hypothetical protein Q8N91_02025 [Candidatus Omnitrophota bacterium]|nr:hypothetical protein [Candidatus Omnitrophota bacterium]